jgi:RNA ligase (TIGR02306 family)
MSDIERKLAVLETIEEIKPIEGADNIEAVRIRGWWCVAKKGEFQLGDKCVYFEIDSFLPIREEFEFLRKSSYKKMQGDLEGFRLRTIKLRGQISQGLALPLNAINEDLSMFEVGDNLTETLNVIKYERPIPATMSGRAKGNFPMFIIKTDEERIQNYLRHINFQDKASKYVVTEKIDGTSFTCYIKDKNFGVCSRNYDLEFTDDNVYWKCAVQYGLKEKLEEKYDNIAIQGELIGPDIQNNLYKLSEYKLFVFSIQKIEDRTYLPYGEMKERCEDLGLELAPILDDNFTVLDSLDEMLNYADGKSVINPSTNREGVVIRNQDKTLSFKVISNAWLLKND